MDIAARQENLAVRGEPIMLQLCIVPSYALTIHKTQALSIKHFVIGCLEGVIVIRCRGLGLFGVLCRPFLGL